MNYKNIFNGKNKYPVLIAEIGINHNGSISLAKKMIKSAKLSGADVVKFQTHIVDKEMLPDNNQNKKASHLKGESLYQILKKCSFSKKQHIELMNYCKSLNVLFLSTPFCIEAVDLLSEIEVEAYKIGSGETNNYNFVDYVLSKKKPVFISTGTSSHLNLTNLKKNIKYNQNKLIVMQCTSNYPTNYVDSNVKYILEIKKLFKTNVGFSDHSSGNYASFAASVIGASVIERHFTLSRSLPGIDQSSSLEPNEFKDLRDGLNAITDSMGKNKNVNRESKKVINGFSHSIVSIANIKKGEKLIKGSNIWYKRPGSGISANKINDIHGKKALKRIDIDSLLKKTDFS